MDGVPLTDPAARDWRRHLKNTRTGRGARLGVAAINNRLAAVDAFFALRGSGQPPVVREHLARPPAPRTLDQRTLLRFLRTVARDAGPRDRAICHLAYKGRAPGSQAPAQAKAAACSRVHFSNEVTSSPRALACSGRPTWGTAFIQSWPVPAGCRPAELADTADAREALTRWLEAFTDYASSSWGMAEVLVAEGLVGTDDTEACSARLTAVVAPLLHRAVRDGAAAPGATPADLVTLVSGIALATEGRADAAGEARRLLRLTLAGVQAPA